MVTIQRPLYTGSGFRCLDGNNVPMWYSEEVDSLEQAIYDLVADIRAVAGGPGSTLTGLLEAIAAIVTTVDGLVTLINGKVDDLNDAIGTVLPPTYPGLIDRIEDLRSATAHALPATTYNLGNIYDALTAPLNVGTLPDPPPEGYGGGASASDVWGEMLTLDENTGYGNTESAAYVMRQLLNHHLWAGQYQGWVSKGNPLFRFFQQWSSGNYAAKYFKWNSNPPAPPNPDWTTWNGTDDVATFLNAAAPGNGWSYTDPWGATSQLAWSPAISENVNFYWRCEVLPWMLPYLSGRAYSAAMAGGAVRPPAWPGLAGVTLGTPVVLTDDGRVEATMHGCLLEITATDPGSGRIEFEGNSWWYRAGFLAFEDADGNLERHDYLNRELGVYTCQTMTQAAAVVVHLDRASQVTVTPWTLAA